MFLNSRLFLWRKLPDSEPSPRCTEASTGTDEGKRIRLARDLSSVLPLSLFDEIILKENNLVSSIEY